MNPTKALAQARELIADPKRWAKRFYARDAAGDAAMPYSTEACAWDVLGAIASVVIRGGGGHADIKRAADLLRAAIGTTDLPGWNDKRKRKHGEVLAAFDAAIRAGVLEDARDGP
jgi:hypothetical protein